ncbi:MAG: AAA family ATPase [Eubacteriales bacterium]|nr:AAA family ATPase [Eubacteriales bacterium]
MKITKLTATFGKFNNESISFHEGLNIIYAPNESGKSTWCAFIKAMLYGVDSSERAREGYLPDKQHYAPWSGAPMEGMMELTSDRCDITLTRTTRSRNAPMQVFSAEYTGTSTPVKGITGASCGEQLTGVSRDVFCRSAFVEQGSAALTGSPELEKRIQAIISTGEEETSFSEAEERLQIWQRRRKLNRRGLIPEMDQKIEDLSIQLESVNQSAEKLDELEEQLAVSRMECISLENAVTEARKQHRKAIIGGLTEARNEERKLIEEQNKALSELDDCREELRRSVFGSRPSEEVEAEAENDLQEVELLQHNIAGTFSVIPVIILLMLAAVGAIIYENFFRYLTVIIACAVVSVAAIVFLFRFISSYRSSRIAQERISQILRKYAASTPEQITDHLDAHHALCIATQKAAEKVRATAAAVEKAGEHLGDLEGKAAEELDFVGGSSEAARLGKQLAAQRALTTQLTATVAAEESRLAVLGDPIVLRGELNCLKSERSKLQEEYDAIGMALTALREADDEIQSRFSPKLGEIAAQYMSFVTGGKYENILLDKDFSAKAKAKDDVVARDSEYLSAGTADLLYLAVRLAVCELALPDGEPCPLIIDDALVNLDDERYEQAMKLLEEIARERQVILFSCRK